MSDTKIAFIYQNVGNTSGARFMDLDFVISKGLFNFYDYTETAHIDLLENHLIGNTIDATLENIFTYGNTTDEYHIQNPRARSISVSDIICIDNQYFYCNSTGFEDITQMILDILNDEFDKRNNLTEARDEDENIIEDDIPEEDAPDEEDTDDDKTLLDYLQDRVGQEMSVGELNAVLQSLFAQFNKVFLMTSDLYNMDLDENQELVVWDDDDMYVINYDIVDMDNGIIEITDVNVE